MTTTPSQPLVSVLIPTFNGARYLRETLDCVMTQTWPVLEIIVSDDGSTDDTLAIVSEAQQQSKVPLRLVKNPRPGMVDNWNHCIGLAQGEFLKFVFQDDLITPDCVERLLQALLAHPSAGLAYGRRQVLLSDGAENNPYCRDILAGCQDLHLGWGDSMPGEKGLDYLAHPAFFEGSINKIGEPSAVLLRREVFERLGGFDDGFVQLMDLELWVRIMTHYDLVFVDASLAVFRVHPAQQSVKNLVGQESHQDMLRFAQKVCSDPVFATVPVGFRAGTFRAVERLLEQARHDASDFRTQRDRGSEQITRLEQYRDHLHTVIKDQHAAMDQQLRAQQLTVRDQQLTIEQLNKQISDGHRQLQNEEALVNALRHDLNIIYNSRSWKLTRPLRLVGRVKYLLRVEGLGGLLKRVQFKLFGAGSRLPIVIGSAPSQIRPLQFPEVSEPLISIVIPVFNKIEYTFHCLDAVLRSSSGVACEVIVVDDCSSDRTAAVLADISGIRVLRNETNQGFIRSCNRGAAAARGRYLLLLNNDTEPQPGWLEALLNTFVDQPDCGMVGAKLLFGSGTLQEAGGIVWRDGSAWNYGRGEDANHPDYSYCRAVDYCSGACLLLPTAAFHALGGFDEHYLPAYYEDTDLAFQVRKAGKQVYYQPLARVVHFEGITNGTDAGSGVKAHQVTNQQKFFARWEQALKSHRPAGVLPQLERERSVEKRALVVDARVLMPDNDSGSLRMFNLLKILQQLGYKVTFIPDNMQYHERYTPLLQALGIECWYVPFCLNVRQHLELRGASYDLVILSRADVGERNAGAVRECAPQAKLLFDTVDLHFLRERRQAELSGSALEAEAAELRRLQELGTARKADVTLVVSPVEVELFRQEAPDVNVALLSNIHAVQGCRQPFEQREHLLFIGNFEHPPNVDAIQFFIDEVMPALSIQRPDLKLLIVGAHAPKSLIDKAGPSVEFLGFVPDITPLFDSVRLSVAPLRYGAGVKGKINSSMSCGVPVVATSMAAEGMNLVDGVDVLIADTPQDLAQAVLRVYDDKALWERLSQGGLKNLQDNFSFERATAQLQAVLSAP
ncbi:MAG: glycosyltransferase [Pseudohongiellaceae bacterium]